LSQCLSGLYLRIEHVLWRTYSIPLEVYRNVEKTKDSKSSHEIFGREKGFGSKAIIKESEPEFHLRDALARTGDLALDHRSAGMLGLHEGFEFDAIARDHDAMKGRFGYLGQHRLARETLGLRYQ
jgi:hypothetical protein